MDLRIATKKFGPLNFNENNGYPTPPSSNGSVPGTQFSSGSPNADVRCHLKMDAKQSTHLLNKLQSIMKLTYRPIHIPLNINENVFITMDKDDFCEKRRIRVQEDSILKEEKELKKFKPSDFKILSKSLKTTKDTDFLTNILQSDITKSKPLDESKGSNLAWSSYLSGLKEERAVSGEQVPSSHTKGVKSNQYNKEHRDRAFDILLRMDASTLTLGATQTIIKTPAPKPVKNTNPSKKQGNNAKCPEMYPSSSGLQHEQTATRTTRTNGNSIAEEIALKYPYHSDQSPDLLVIGPHGSTIPKAVWNSINWAQAPALITRKILVSLFDKYTLATHNLSGRPSPAFKGIQKAEKLPLDAGKVADTILIMTSHAKVTPKEVRMAITTKCADECKMLKQRLAKKDQVQTEVLTKFPSEKS